MTLYIDDSLMTALITVPLRERWVEAEVPYEVRKGLAAGDLGPGDVALLPSPEATLLGRTHFIDPSVAVVSEAKSAIAMQTPVRPDGVEATPINAVGAGALAEVLLRALLRPYFGITASSFIRDAADPALAEAQVTLLDGMDALRKVEDGFREDLAKAWFILTNSPVVHAVTVVGVEAEARGADAEIGLLRDAVASGIERRRDIRRDLIGDDESVDRDRLVALTNGARFAFDDADRQAYRNLMARGVWGTNYQRVVPAFRDELDADV